VLLVDADLSVDDPEAFLELGELVLDVSLLLFGDWGKIPTWAVVASIVATAVLPVRSSVAGLAALSDL
jgi:hypothetical protein